MRAPNSIPSSTDATCKAVNEVFALMERAHFPPVNVERAVQTHPNLTCAAQTGTARLPGCALTANVSAMGGQAVPIARTLTFKIKTKLMAMDTSIQHGVSRYPMQSILVGMLHISAVYFLSTNVVRVHVHLQYNANANTRSTSLMLHKHTGSWGGNAVLGKDNQWHLFMVCKPSTSLSRKGRYHFR